MSDDRRSEAAPQGIHAAKLRSVDKLRASLSDAVKDRWKTIDPGSSAAEPEVRGGRKS